jgi:CheY-like chemotaxis protein
MPIIALMAHAIQGDQEWCVQAGIDGSITKRLQVNELLEVVEGALYPLRHEASDFCPS